jgi:GT2 family glycosyltransferase
MAEAGACGGEFHVGVEAQRGIAIVVLTHNRVHLLRQCVENVLSRTSRAAHEIIIWDNASTDGTAAHLGSLEDPRIRVVRSDANVGQNGYARGFRLTSAPYLIELDDDVVGAPPEWDLMLRDAFRRLPHIGFLAADLEDDPHDLAAHYRYRVRPHEYVETIEYGVRLLRGPTGGGCAITSRELNEKVGGFREDPKRVFWLEDEAYIADLARMGYEAAVLADLKVHHTGGTYYGATSAEKDKFWAHFWTRQERRARIKRMIFRVPFFRRLNARFAWFVAPP